MRKEQMVGAKLPEELVRELETIECVEQSDRSTTVRKLLYKAVKDWKIEHYARLYGDGKLTLAKTASSAGVSLWEMMDYVRNRKISAQYDYQILYRSSQLKNLRAAFKAMGGRHNCICRRNNCQNGKIN